MDCEEYLDVYYGDNFDEDNEECEELENICKAGNSSKVKASTAKKKKKPGTDFTAENKKQLAAEVKKKPLIWDLSNSQHFNVRAIGLAWKEIGASMDKSVDDCKAAWTSLRQSYRYHVKASHKRKSGSAGGLPIDEASFDQDTLDWEFAEDVCFLPDTSKKRRSFTSSTLEEADIETTTSSNYTYQARPSTASSSTLDDNPVVQLLENVGELIKNQKEMVEIQKTMTAVPPVPVQNEPPLVHKIFLANIDRMLQQLPPNAVEKVCFDITTLVFNKIEEHSNKTK